MWKNLAYISRLLQDNLSASELKDSQQKVEISHPDKSDLDKNLRGFHDYARLAPELWEVLLQEGGAILLSYGEDCPTHPFVERMVPIAIRPAGTEALQMLSPEMPCIIAWHLLHRVDDYRSLLAECFSKVKTGGSLIIVVPNQYTYERRLQLPSANPSHLRLYSLAKLLAEIEEAIDPLEIKIRIATQIEGTNSDPFEAHDLIVALEKVPPPEWRESFFEGDRPVVALGRPSSILPVESDNANYSIIYPDTASFYNIAILKLDHRGDFLLARQAFSILKEIFPASKITLICGSWNKQEAESTGLFHNVLPFDFFTEDMSARACALTEEERSATFAKLVADRSFDLAIDLRLTGDTRHLLCHINARHRAGFGEIGVFPWLDIKLNIPSATHEGRAKQEFWSADNFSSLPNHHKNFEIVYEDAQYDRQHIVWGPYKDVTEGRFGLDLVFDPAKGCGVIEYDICADRGTAVIHRGLIDTTREITSIYLESMTPLHGLEFRIYSATSQQCSFSFRGIRYVKHGSYSGVHQEEAMALLAHFVALRTKRPFLNWIEQ